MRNEEEAIKIVYLTSRMGLTHSTDEAMIKGDAVHVTRMSMY